jgi:hypothetical protein
LAGPFVELNFGLVEIDWDREGGAVLTLAVVGVEGQRGFEEGIPIAALSPGGRAGGRAR